MIHTIYSLLVYIKRHIVMISIFFFFSLMVRRSRARGASFANRLNSLVPSSRVTMRPRGSTHPRWLALSLSPLTRKRKETIAWLWYKNLLQMNGRRPSNTQFGITRAIATRYISDSSREADAFYTRMKTFNADVCVEK